MDVLMFNQELSFVAERNLQAVGATDCLEGQNTASIHLHLFHSICKQNMQQSKGSSTAWIVQSSIYYLMEPNGTGRVMAAWLFSPQSWKCQSRHKAYRDDFSRLADSETRVPEAWVDGHWVLKER